MIKTSELVAAFEEIIGWRYESPGTNDQNGIDCSGAFVRAYRKYGLNIAHGSNTIFRNHCGAVGPINGNMSRLHVGMAVFKQRMDGGEPDKFRGDGFGNMYHIGLVASVSPLRIIHATTPVAKADTSLGKGDSAWDYYGWLEDEDYGSFDLGGSGDSDCLNDGDAGAAPSASGLTGADEPATEAGTGQAAPTAAVLSQPRYVRVKTPDGNGVRAREEPSLKAIYKYTVPESTVLQVLADKGNFLRVHYLGKARYVDKRFVVTHQG